MKRPSIQIRLMILVGFYVVITTSPAHSQAAPATRPSDANSTITFQIQVVDESGQPLEGVIVKPTGLRSRAYSGSHYGWKDAYGSNAAQETDAAGIATLSAPVYINEKIETGFLTADISHPGFTPLSHNNLDVSKSMQSVILKRGGSLTLDLKFEPGARPLQSVYIFSTSNKYAEQEWSELPDGRISMTSLAPGVQHIYAASIVKNAPSLFSDVIQVNVEPGKSDVLNLTLKPGIRLAGLLDDAAPRPITQGEIALEVSLDDQHGLRWFDWTTIASDGTFSFESIPRGLAQFVAICDGWVTQRSIIEDQFHCVIPQSVELSRDARDQQIVLTMEPTATLEVLVVDPAGHPIEGAQVFCASGVQWTDSSTSLVWGHGRSWKDYLGATEEERERYSQKLRDANLDHTRAVSGADGVQD